MEKRTANAQTDLYLPILEPHRSRNDDVDPRAELDAGDGQGDGDADHDCERGPGVDEVAQPAEGAAAQQRVEAGLEAHGQPADVAGEAHHHGHQGVDGPGVQACGKSLVKEGK